MPRFSFEDYAATELHHAGMDQARVPTVAAILRWCDSLGQFREYPGGFVAFLRCNWASVPLFEEKDGVLAYQLGREELTTGPVLYIAEMLALVTGSSRTAIRTLIRLPGVEALCGHVFYGRRPGWRLEPMVDLRGRPLTLQELLAGRPQTTDLLSRVAAQIKLQLLGPPAADRFN